MTCGCEEEGCFEENCPEPPMDGEDVCRHCKVGDHL